MPAAARVGDLTDHPGVLIGPGISTVLVKGVPICTVGDLHACLAGHPPTPIVTGSKSVLAGGRQVARVKDKVGCGATIVTGAKSVIVGNRGKRCRKLLEKSIELGISLDISIGLDISLGLDFDIGIGVGIGADIGLGGDIGIGIGK